MPEVLVEQTTVLVADDHAVVRAGIANAIADLQGVQIAGEVGDGPTLFSALELLRPHCLLIDVAMPGFDPIGDIRVIRARYPLLKILVVSAYDDDVYVQGLLGVGVNGYHLKDQPLADLRLAVQRILAGERWICSPLVAKLVQLRDTSLPSLTNRQRDLLLCLQEGLDNLAIARRTGLSVKTIENHLTRLYRQLGVQSRLEAVSYLRQHSARLLNQGPTAYREAEYGTQPNALLIVDDNERYRSQVRRMVSRSYPAITILEASSTREALLQVQRHAPQLALVDVVLGDEHGIECTRVLHAASPTTRIILFSAYPDREFHRQGLQAGAVAFLDKKDVDAAALRELIDDVLAS
jgi:DNA-binding NarL/FixJ family response regulator